MIKITSKNNCCGCSACAERCPRKCITMESDEEGFLYPRVDESECSNCGLCDSVCPFAQPYEARDEAETFAAINYDEQVRANSSSGGIFYLLAENNIAEGGVVFGAKFTDEWQVEISYAESIEEVKRFMGSKYTQATVGCAYADAERFLKSGRKVLFSGTPCQIAGLRHFLRKDYAGLTTVDILCHGVPSPNVWGRYIKELVQTVREEVKPGKDRYHKKLRKLKFRLATSPKDGTTSAVCIHKDNHYMQAFLGNLILRPSCYRCKAKEGRSHSDITIADFWGIEKEYPEMFDNKGTSLIIIGSERGEKVIDWGKIKATKVQPQMAKRNGGFSATITIPPNRATFFAKLNKAESVTDLIKETTKQPFLRMAKSSIKYWIKTVLEALQICKGRTETHFRKKGTRTIIRKRNIGKVIDIEFRDKRYGWMNFSLVVTFKLNGDTDACPQK